MKNSVRFPPDVALLFVNIIVDLAINFGAYLLHGLFVDGGE